MRNPDSGRHLCSAARFTCNALLCCPPGWAAPDLQPLAISAPRRTGHAAPQPLLKAESVWSLLSLQSLLCPSSPGVVSQFQELGPTTVSLPTTYVLNISKTTNSVLKSGFHYYYLGMARPVDQETTTTEKTVCYPQFPRGKEAPGSLCGEDHGGRPASQEVGGGRG